MGDKVRFLRSFHILSIPFEKKLVPKKEVLNPLHPHDLTYPIDLPVNFFFLLPSSKKYYGFKTPWLTG